MALIYPPNRSTLRYREMRWELLCELKELSDPEYQRQAWVERTIDTHMVLGIDQTVHFFFDDTPLNDNPTNMIGGTLFDEAEVELIRPITALLNAMLDDLAREKRTEPRPHRQENEAFLNHKLWPELVACAQRAKTFFDARGVPEFAPQ